ncbi:MAG: hypothetical protein K0Q74_1345 [Gammaproteobacteria bacterium]|nr:hypothetical protein [Gammaproteobacteria bacterium]
MSEQTSVVSKKAGTVLAIAAGAAFVVMSGCATQGSGEATAANMATGKNCKVIESCSTPNTWKGKAACNTKAKKTTHACGGKAEN